jgi:hypothetical protein
MCTDVTSREIIFRFILRYGVEKRLKPASQDLVFEDTQRVNATTTRQCASTSKSSSFIEI